MSDAGGATPTQPYGQPAAPPPEEGGESFASRIALAQRAGGAVAPLLTVLLAFVMGGLVVLVTTGKNPITRIARSSTAPASTGSSRSRWDTGSDAAFNLQQTLIYTTTLILVGLAVAFAFRCGLFNIGGLGQYLAGAILAVWVGSSFAGMSPIPHVLLVLVVGTLAGALLAGIAGFLKATVGAHEVITTIMLNWTVVYVGLFLFGLGGPLQNDTQSSTPVSNDVVEGAKLHVFWGDPLLQGLHIGFFIALGALVVYWAILNRTTLGYGVKAVGFNPEAARYGGISVARNYFLAMAISGAFAGIAGAIDILGWQFRLSTSDITQASSGRSRSPASPSRCSAATRPWEPSSRRCSSARSSPERRPATSIPRSSSRTSRRTSRCSSRASSSSSSASTSSFSGFWRACAGGGWWRRDEPRTARRRDPEPAPHTGLGGHRGRPLGGLRRAPADLVALVGPEPAARASRRARRDLRLHAGRAAVRHVRGRDGAARVRPRIPRHALVDREARHRRRLVGALCRDAPVRDAAHLRRARRDVLGALRVW